MERKDYYKIALLMLIPFLVFIPLFSSSYYYTDEITQLWYYRKGSSFAMFVSQGRLLNDWLFRLLYSNIDTIPQLRWLRLFSLLGWLIVIPIWYRVFSRVVRDEGLPSSLAFSGLLFLVTSLPFSISIQWAACMELFIANTAGLLSGYLVYRYHRRAWLPALLLGLVSLFFYQNGFGCFLLPFLLQVIAKRKWSRQLLEPLFVYLAIYVAYFLLFSGLLHFVLHATITERAALFNNPFAKLYFLLRRALPQAFYFNKVLSERSWIGVIILVLLGALCLALDYKRMPRRVSDLAAYALLVFGIWILIYLPSLIIRENYASNRTLLGLDLAVFLWVCASLLQAIRQPRWQSLFLNSVGVLLILSSFYNFRSVFLRPAVDEYQELKAFIDKNYNPSITSFDYIRSPEDQVRKIYTLPSSWDEYGFSSAYFAWVPDAAIRQLVFERTGDRTLAEKLIIREWNDRPNSHQQTEKGSLLVDFPAISGNQKQ